MVYPVTSSVELLAGLQQDADIAQAVAGVAEIEPNLKY